MLPLNHAWSKSFGDTGYDYGEKVGVDAAGNVYLAGRFAGKVDFGGGTLSSAGSQDIVLASYTLSGAHRWSKRFGGKSDDRVSGLVVDSTGNVTITGEIDATVDFGGGKLTSQGVDIYLASFTSAGVHRWSKLFGDAFVQRGEALAVDMKGNITVAGQNYKTINLGGATLTGLGFLASFTDDGIYHWSMGFNTSAIKDLSADALGNVCAVGSFQSSVNFGGSTLSSKGSSDISLASFTSTGAHRWSKAFGDEFSDSGYGVSVDSSGNIVLVGSFAGAVDFGGGALVSEGGSDAVVASFTGSGTHRWSKRFGDASTQSIRAAVMDGEGNSYMTGDFAGTMSLGGDDPSDLYVVSLTTDGGHRWSQRFGGANSEYGQALARAPSGDVLVVGELSGSVDFGGAVLTSEGLTDLYLLALTP